MSGREKIERLESRITELENENLILKSMLKQQAVFGNKITEIVSKMDEILEKKKLEIESLTNQLLGKSTNETVNDFAIDLVPAMVSESQVSFLEVQERIKLKKEILEKEKTKDGKFKCPYQDICNYVSKYRANLKKHIRIHTGEKPFICHICGRGFAQQEGCKKHILTHPGMNGVQCEFCRVRIMKSEMKNHQCQARKKRKRSFKTEHCPETFSTG